MLGIKLKEDGDLQRNYPLYSFKFIHFPKFESCRCLGGMFDVFSPSGFEIQSDFEYRTSKTKFYCLKALKRYLNEKNLIHDRVKATISKFIVHRFLKRTLAAVLWLCQETNIIVGMVHMTRLQSKETSEMHFALLTQVTASRGENSLFFASFRHLPLTPFFILSTVSEDSVNYASFGNSGFF